MTSKINNAVRPEHTASTVVATEEQQLLELVLQARARRSMLGSPYPLSAAKISQRDASRAEKIADFTQRVWGLR
jgi:hypothetical protein